MRRVILAISLIFFGCDSSSTNMDSTNQDSSVDANSSDTPPSPPKEYFDTNYTLSFVSNEIIFGNQQFRKTTNFVDGEFGTISYPESATKEIFQLSLEIEQVESSRKNVVVRVDEVGSSRVAVLVFPDIRFQSSGNIDNSNCKSIYFYGIRGDGFPISTELDLGKSKVDINSLIFSQDGNLTISLYKSVDEVAEALGQNVSLESYIVSGKEIELTLGWTNTDYLAEGVEVSDKLKYGFKGDTKTSIENKLTEGITYGFTGRIKIE